MVGMVSRAGAVALAVGISGCAGYVEPGVSTSAAYLQRAQDSAQAHDATATLAALDVAENAWLSTPAAQGNPCMYYEKEELRAIGYARDSVKHARWNDARRFIAEALANVGGTG